MLSKKKNCSVLLLFTKALSEYLNFTKKKVKNNVMYLVYFVFNLEIS